MQPKGAISFNDSQISKPIKSDEIRKKQLLEQVFAVDNSGAKNPDEVEQPKTPDQQISQAEEEAQKDIIKDSIKDEEKSSSKLDNLTKLAELVLYRTKTTNPFDLFPDEIIVDMNKVSVIFNKFFLSARIHSVMIKDVSDIFIETGFLWAKLIIVDKGFVENTVEITFLNKDEALKIRRIVQGLVIAQQQEIDFTKLEQELNSEQITEKLEKLGKARLTNDAS